MTRYQLAKLVEWAGTLRTRKRLQKVVYLLQAAGCPLDNPFILHHFGPYSSDVAQRTDEMTNVGLLQEECVGNPGYQQYNYVLSDAARHRITALEATPHGREWAEKLAPFENRAKELLSKEVRELEVAATIVYFRCSGLQWPEAVTRTCSFKGINPSEGLVQRAETLARSLAIGRKTLVEQCTDHSGLSFI